jgi:hypothetical protein
MTTTLEDFDDPFFDMEPPFNGPFPRPLIPENLPDKDRLYLLEKLEIFRRRGNFSERSFLHLRFGFEI